ncbi:hypothetical protein [Nocardia goodfellowii]|uniref:Uncharacterized protein n=1 Tax=Nocardia goodfellowii TaxID=882446 RepID=A0ABS4QG93_9NOCA|nr:hypothetical protein [Nocardia goodfellowii]MBP2190690.1 hypothetical protein [Nocardia goodfellowii]
MTKKYGRKNPNRPSKPSAPPKKNRQSLPELKVVPKRERGGTLTARWITHQDSILPVALKFRPPLREYSAEPAHFEYHWQHLTYAFGLPDPADFPPLTSPVDSADRRNLMRFVQVCEKTAAYSVVSHKGGMTMSLENGDATMAFNRAEDDITVGFSVRFRQLHSSSAGDPDFSNVANILAKYAKRESDGHAGKRMEILAAWRKARGQLMNQPLQNIVCRTVLASHGYTSAQIDQLEMYGDVNPAEIINLYNYGELIHFGKHSEAYDELAEDPEQEGIQYHNFMVSMLGLVHLYFGFSMVIQAALKGPSSAIKG